MRRDSGMYVCMCTQVRVGAYALEASECWVYVMDRNEHFFDKKSWGAKKSIVGISLENVVTFTFLGLDLSSSFPISSSQSHSTDTKV